MEEALQQKQMFMKTIMDNLPIGAAVNTVVPQVHFQYMNDNFAKFYQTTKEALNEVGALWDVVYENVEFRERIKTQVLAACASADRIPHPDLFGATAASLSTNLGDKVCLTGADYSVFEKSNVYRKKVGFLFHCSECLM